MSSIEFGDKDILVNGVPTSTIVSSLKAAGLSDEAAAAVIGRILVGGGGAAPAPFHFQTQVPEEVPDCVPTYARQFAHLDWIDGESLVQAGTTPEELGFNARFHAIEHELDAIAAQFGVLGSCLAELRKELFGIVQELQAKITEIESEIGKQGKETKETKEIVKEKEAKEKEKEVSKEKDSKEKEGKEDKEGKEAPKEHDKAAPKETDKTAPKETDVPGPSLTAAPSPGTGGATVARGRWPEESGRAFIRPEERPELGGRALREAGGG